jgi:aspartyl-tRNA(Asn)/glutamyl-tRNA(Gln) amidotransferase subunit C
VAESTGNPATLSDTEVRKVARLARLALSDEQVHAMRTQLAAILGYIERLRGLDLAGVEPMAHVGGGEATNRLDDDVPGPTLSNADLMRMAPDAMEPFIKVPKVLGDGGGA